MANTYIIQNDVHPLENVLMLVGITCIDTKFSCRLCISNLSEAGTIEV